jgi:hypothetical protein
LISGEFQPYSEGQIVELVNCEFIGGTSPPQSALTPSLQAHDFVFRVLADRAGRGECLASATVAKAAEDYFLADNTTPSLNAHKSPVNQRAGKKPSLTRSS